MPYILIVEDDQDTREMLSALAHAQQLNCDAVPTLAQAREKIAKRVPDLILADLMLPDGDGMTLIDDFPHAADVEVVLMTGHASLDTAIDALRRGAADYLVKPINMQRLNGILARVPRTDELRGEILALRAQLQQLGRFGRMLGNSPVMQDVYRAISRVAPSEAAVFLMGESGTGKELAAQTVHDLSLRRKGPFVAVNCGAIAANLVESEMFGHDRGSFTGAERQHKGYFERADGGTLFLDEVTEMPLDLQVKLLRVLETGRFLRVGTQREIACDVRVVAATNRSPEQAVREGKLREDLYYRLAVFPLELPPLRARGDDILVLADRFLALLNADYGTSKVFGDDARRRMAMHDWPGNVRELRNYVRRAYVMAEGEVLDAPLLPPKLAAPEEDRPGSVTLRVGATLAEADRRLILATLARCGGIKKQTAAILGVSPKTLYNRLEAYAAEGYTVQEESAS